MLVYFTLIKKKIKISSYIRKFRMEQLQSPLHSTLNFLIYEENFIFFFISVRTIQMCELKSQPII
jgi:hypothetical protein